MRGDNVGLGDKPNLPGCRKTSRGGNKLMQYSHSDFVISFVAYLLANSFCLSPRLVYPLLPAVM